MTQDEDSRITCGLFMFGIVAVFAMHFALRFLGWL
jgi:hypothetical protein